MLIRRPILERIKAGEITLAFRRWRKPTVRRGGTLKTAVGLLAFDGVDIVDPMDITDDDARRAGFPDRPSLLAALSDRDGEVYRIEVAYAGDDPRIALRENDRLSDADVAAIVTKLRRLDKASKLGPWTYIVLETIETSPHVAAGLLAIRLGYERAWLKPNIRKLKAMGLTISHRPGYELSPRGHAVLVHLRSAGPD